MRASAVSSQVVLEEDVARMMHKHTVEAARMIGQSGSESEGVGGRPVSRDQQPRHRLRQLLCVITTLSLLVVAGEGVGQAAAAAEPVTVGALEVAEPVQVRGKLPLFERLAPQPDEPTVAQTYLIVNPRTRRGYQIYLSHNWDRDKVGITRFNSQATYTVVWSFDLDTLKPIRRVVIPQFLPYGAPVISNWHAGGLIHTIDEEGGRFFLAGVGIGDSGIAADRAFRLAVVDESKLDDGESNFFSFRGIPILQRAELERSLPFGMAFSERSGSGKLLLLFSLDGRRDTVNTAAPTHHRLVQWDANSGAGDWSLPLDQCASGVLAPGADSDLWYQLAIVRTDRYVLIPCQDGTNAKVVKIPLDGSGRPVADAQESFGLPRKLGSTLADPASGRLFIAARSQGVSWWAFDGDDEAFVGVAGTTLWAGYASSAGIDQASGRIYSLVPDHVNGIGDDIRAVEGGLFIGDMRLTPTSQFDRFVPEIDDQSVFQIGVDNRAGPGLRRVFVLRGMIAGGSALPDYPSTEDSRAPAFDDGYTVVEDRLPIPRQPSRFGDLDALTDGVKPVPGLTQEKFESEGSGFGFRHLLVRGINSLPGAHLNLDTQGTCYTNDREIVLGAVTSAKLSDLVASAASVSLNIDQGTQVDLEKPGTRCWPVAASLLPLSDQDASEVKNFVDFNAGQGQWKDDDLKAECTGTRDVESAEREENFQAYRARTNCRQAEGRVSAAASSEILVRPELPVRVASTDTV
ncbi:MAG TPA: hypothetical protein VM618_03570, partial [Acidimicrobiia bacterium]|nr:hypothetical protein [Acidimicrobiia bacterium]